MTTITVTAFGILHSSIKFYQIDIVFILRVSPTKMNKNVKIKIAGFEEFFFFQIDYEYKQFDLFVYNRFHRLDLNRKNTTCQYPSFRPFQVCVQLDRTSLSGHGVFSSTT